MAEGVLINLATSVLQQLSSPALEEFLRLWNFRKELKKLECTIEAINCVLHDAERRQSKEHLVQGWLAKLRVVMYDADDLFDAIAARALRRKALAGNEFNKEVGLFFSKSKLGFMTAYKVKAIRDRLDDIANDMGRFSFLTNQFRDQPVQVQAREETQSFVRVNDIVGRDQEKEEIIKLLLHEGEDSYQRNFSVIAIIGFGGLGKTTLAQFVCNDERVQMGFDLCAWACINYFNNLKEVLMEIINSIIELEYHDNNLDELQKKLRENFKGKKYLLVLDDVWDEDEPNWQNLKTLLDCGQSGSKILVTTRSIKVARCLDALKPYYHLNVISEESAWSLFEKKAFKEGELDENPELESLGRQIVRKCGCVPLALVTIGIMLSCKKKEKTVWLRFVEKEISELLDNEDSKIIQTLKISYDDLPLMLKNCFAHCSLFPKGYTFEKSELVRMWQAQGFVVPRPEQSLEEAGDKYFYYLVDRCFLQVVSREHDTRKGGYECKMHDLIHDLARHVAGVESKGFFNEAPSRIGGNRTLRHICVIDTRLGSSLDCTSLLPHSKTLRTLLCRVAINVENLNMILGRFRMLRTLSMIGLNVEKLPDSIGALIHLRYLKLSCSNVKVLPNSICELYHLQILSLEWCSTLKELPPDIGKLISLRHLFLKGCNNLTSLPPTLAALTSLVTLDRFIVHHLYGGLKYLGQLDDLCGTVNVELPTVGWSNAVEDARKSNMSRKQRLNRMILKWQKSKVCDAPKMADDEVKAVMEALEPHDSLQYLKISNYGGSTLPSWIFSLKKLKELRLRNFTLEYLDDRLRFDLLLPSLEILKIESMPNLKGWWKQVAAGGDHRRLSLPCLSCVSEIVIEDCPKLTESMPLLRTEKLILAKVNEKLLAEFLIGNTTDCSSSLSSSSFECHYNNNLKELRLEIVEGLTCLPKDWIMHLTALQILVIDNCYDLSSVSCDGLAHLTALQELDISWCGAVDLVVKEDEKLGNGVSWKALQHLRVLKLPVGDKHFQRGLQYLTALEELKIETWKKEEEQVVYDHEEREGDGIPWKGLKRLRSLIIGYGNKTTVFPKGIQHLCSLQYLMILHCKELSLSWITIANMRLKSLSLCWVDKVVNVDEMVEREHPFTSPYELCIFGSMEAEWIHDIPWKLFPSLTSLKFRELSTLKSVPDGIQHLTSLRRLTIENCKGIRALPSWMLNLTALKEFNPWNCSPELKKRCEAETGEDWHLISHIPRETITMTDSDKWLMEIDGTVEPPAAGGENRWRLLSY